MKKYKYSEEIKPTLICIVDHPLKSNLRFFLNIITKGNYEKIKENIFNIIKDDIYYQKLFVDVIFQKGISGQAYTER